MNWTQDFIAAGMNPERARKRAEELQWQSYEERAWQSEGLTETQSWPEEWLNEKEIVAIDGGETIEKNLYGHTWFVYRNRRGGITAKR